MSSILKALKKIDETAAETDHVHPWPHPGQAQDAITRRIRKRWFLRRLTTYILVAACLISLGVLVYLRQSERSAGPPADAPGRTAAGQTGPVHRAKIDRSAAPDSRSNGGPGPQRKAAAEPQPDGVPMSAPAPKAPAEINRTRPEPLVQSGRVGPVRTAPLTPQPKRSKKAATKINPPPQQKAHQGQPATPPAKKSAAGAPIQKGPQYDRLQDSDLILQAIAWSPEPASRIAVINGSIVREGEAVNGFTLVRIRPDDIVLNDGNKSWQLDFPLQR